MSTAPPATKVYRPCHPQSTALYQLLQGDFETYVRVHAERFEHRYGRLRRVVLRVVDQVLACGRPEGGVARIRCPSCRGEHLLA